MCNKINLHSIYKIMKCFCDLLLHVSVMFAFLIPFIFLNSLTET